MKWIPPRVEWAIEWFTPSKKWKRFTQRFGSRKEAKILAKDLASGWADCTAIGKDDPIRIVRLAPDTAVAIRPETFR